jgi:transcriptional regulator with XRE-family HTH domain
MTSQNGRAFNEWLRAQLKAKKMSQRQLAQQSGVDHSTISRLIRGDRMPSLGTATKLARGLRELRDDADTPQYLGLVAAGSTNPTARVEYALRADDLLSEPQVRQIMEYYLAVRMRRYGRAFPQGGTGTGNNERNSERSMGSAVSAGGRALAVSRVQGVASGPTTGRALPRRGAPTALTIAAPWEDEPPRPSDRSTPRSEDDSPGWNARPKRRIRTAR